VAAARGDDGVVKPDRAVPDQGFRRLDQWTDAQVDLTVEQRFLQHILHADSEREAKAWCGCERLGQGMRQDVLDRRCAGPEPHGARCRAGMLREATSGFLGKPVEPAGLLQQRIPGFGQDQSAAGPLEQGHAETCLEPTDGLGECRLRPAEPIRRAAHMAESGDRLEGRQVFELHHQSISRGNRSIKESDLK